jgi:hypothetical protein
MRMSAWLVCMAMVVTSSGCAGCLGEVRNPTPTGPNPSPIVSGILPIGCTDPESDCGVETTSLEDECPTGDCKPGGLNGKGIYTVVEGNYCFLYAGEPRFCPEAFINTAEGVLIEVRDLESPASVRGSKVTARFQEGLQPQKIVQVKAISSDKGQLSIKYVKDNKAYTATGADLEKLTLEIGPYRTGGGDASPLANFELKVVPFDSDKTKVDGIPRYRVRYRETGLQQPMPWLYQCKGKAEKPELPSADTVTAFLGEKRISGLTAFVTPNPNVTTLGCESGAIVTCMSWGYTPWSGKPGAPERSDHAFGSCLQAKRAAFFVQYNDLTTYTLKGTAIELRDQFGINENDIDYLEAIWSPGGAVCIDTENLRHTQFTNTVKALMTKHKVPSCAQPPVWSKQGKLATGPKTKSVW